MSDRTGQKLGNYHITRLLGRGGYAEVYLAEHIFLKTPVAIKLLHTQLADAQDRDGFLKEAQTVARLVHPNIIRVTDFGIEQEIPYLVMDYAPKGTLRQRHPRGTRVPLPTIVSYVKQIAAGLQYAHQEKLVHRDIKPENMLVGKHDEILLGDFGIALVAQTSQSASTQDVIGTVAYMAPEQIQGKPRFASDQYALAVVAYEWLGGALPFNGSFTELCTQHMFAPPPPLRDRVPDLPQEVEQVIMIALSKDPKERFSSVQAFANALEQACQAPQAHMTPTRQPSQPILRLPATPQAQPQTLASEAQLRTPDTASDKIAPLPRTSSAQPSTSVTTGTNVPSAPSWPPPPPGASGGIPVQAGAGQPFSPVPQPYAPTPSPYPYYPSPPYYPRPVGMQNTNVWSFGIKQFVALLCFLPLLNLSSHFYIVGNSYFFSFYTLITLFCCTVFGPWVGALIAGGDLILAQYVHYPGWFFVNGTFHSVPERYFMEAYRLNWTLVFIACLTGFLIGATGFSMFYRQGGFSRAGAIALAILLGGLLSFGEDIVTFFVLQSNSTSASLAEYLNGTYFLQLGITLAALVVLLLIYSSFSPRARPAPPGYGPMP